MKYLLLFLISYANAAIIEIPVSQAPVLTLQDKEAAFAIQIRITMNKNFQNIAALMKANQAKFWDTSDGLTVQQHFDAFGADQCELRRDFLASAQYLNSLKPGAVVVTEPKIISMSGVGAACKVTVGN